MLLIEPRVQRAHACAQGLDHALSSDRGCGQDRLFALSRVLADFFRGKDPRKNPSC